MYKEEDSENDLTATEIHLSWKKNHYCAVAHIYLRILLCKNCNCVVSFLLKNNHLPTSLVTENPDVGVLFPFGGKNLSYQQLLEDGDARSHGRRVMETVGHAVNGLDDLDLLVPILQDLAKRHVGYSVNKKYFTVRYTKAFVSARCIVFF